MSGQKSSKEAIKANYDRLSRYYDAISGLAEGPLRERGLALLAPQPGEQILEIGAGTGQAMARLQAIQVRYVGVDLSTGMLRVAINHYPDQKCSLLQANGTHLPLAPRLFDAVFMSFTLEIFDAMEIPLVLGEIKRVLRPGGRVGIVSLHKTAPAPWGQRLYEWLHDRFPVAIDCRPIEASQELSKLGYRILARQTEMLTGFLPVEIVVGGLD